jgi:protease IV
MDKLAALGKIATRWFIAVPVLVALGIVLGALVFFNIFPGKPQIGIITIPFIVINEDSAYFISAYMDYARRNDQIKGVVIQLDTPGGGASASERLFIEMRKLREEKPVVVVMNSMVASGGYMMAMGASHTYAKTASLVGNVGVISFAGPMIPAPPSEDMIFTGPSKLTGSTRREWIGLVDLLKQSFAQMVITERGDKLKITPEELLEGRLYPGMEAVRLGLVDEIGDDAAAIEKAASLAGVSNYDLLDVNVEVDRIFVQKIARVFETSSEEGNQQSAIDLLALASQSGNKPGDPSPALEGSGEGDTPINLENLRKFLIGGTLAGTQEDPLPEFPLEITKPKIYYIYAGQSP